MRFYCSSRVFLCVSDLLASFKLERNCKKILGKDLQTEVLPFISIINPLKQQKHEQLGGGQVETAVGRKGVKSWWPF